MRQITAEQFRQAVEHDPAWASKLTEPVEITEYCDNEDSNITQPVESIAYIDGKKAAHLRF